MAKVITVTLNPAVDMIVELPSLLPEAVNKARGSVTYCGGKGLNVSLVLALLGIETTACGFLGTDNAGMFENFCRNRCIGFAFDLLPGSTRTNVKLAVDHKGATDINLPGLSPTPEDLLQLKNKLLGLAKAGDYIILSGSLPPKVPDTIYGDLITAIRRNGSYAYLDASGPALANGLAALPDLAKPNHEELASIDPSGKEDVLTLAEQWVEKGVGCMAVSMGADGALLVDKSTRLKVNRSTVNAVNMVGAGDSFLAAFTYSRIQGWDNQTSLTFATALSGHWVEKMDREKLDIVRVKELAASLKTEIL